MKPAVRGVLGCIVAPLLLCWLLWGLKRMEDGPAVSIETLRGTIVQYYLTPKTEVPLAVRDFHSFEIDGEGLLVQLGPSILRLKRSKPTWDAPLEPQVVTDGLKENDAFTVDAAGVIVVTRGDELYQLGANGLQLVTKMPAALKGAPSRVPGLLYLFKGPNVYLVSNVEGSARRITAFAQPSDSVSALCEAGDGYYVAVDNQILQIYGERKRRLFAMQPGSDIVSLGCTDRPDLLFIATSDTIYALFGMTAVPITHDFGGVVRWHDGRLFALDPKRRFLVGIAGIERAVGLD
jgi:hypothetical protein